MFYERFPEYINTRAMSAGKRAENRRKKVRIAA